MDSKEAPPSGQQASVPQPTSPHPDGPGTFKVTESRSPSSSWPVVPQVDGPGGEGGGGRHLALG